MSMRKRYAVFLNGTFGVVFLIVFYHHIQVRLGGVCRWGVVMVQYKNTGVFL
jgi:hypothetical protein